MTKHADLRTGLKFIDNGPGIIEGYASTFGLPADRAGDVILAGAFGDQPYTVPLLAYHDTWAPIGSALHTPDDRGLFMQATLADTPAAQEMRELVRSGAVPGLSIGYAVKRSIENQWGGCDLLEVDHMETSCVPIPCNPRALVTAAKAFGIESSPDAVTTDEFVRFMKAGRRNAMSDQEALDAAHDLIVKAGATCVTADAEEAAAKAAEAKQRAATAWGLAAAEAFEDALNQ